jgi:hypothetical protein
MTTEPNPIDDILNPEDIDTATETAPQTPEEEQEGILRRALDGGVWNDTQLRPFSKRMRLASDNMGIRFGNLNPDEVSEANSSGFYRGIETDVTIHLWIRQQSDSKVQRAIRMPEPALGKALDWADSIGLDPEHPEWAAGLATMLRAYEDNKKAKASGDFRPADGSRPPAAPRRGN